MAAGEPTQMAAGRAVRPGGSLATRPLHFIWLVDGSGSMAHDGKVQALNTAIREALPPLRQVAGDNPTAEVLVRAVRFGTGATWHVPDPTPVDRFTWPDLTAEGRTDLGHALRLVAGAVRVPPMSDRALPPVLVLVSDGLPTDDYQSGMRALHAEQWGDKAVRLAIAVGHDAARDVLEEFIGVPGGRVLEANSADALVNQIRWASAVALQSAVAPFSASQTEQRWAGRQVPMPGSVETVAPPTSSDEVW
jgi:uncharacterized protein YegL